MSGTGRERRSTLHENGTLTRHQEHVSIPTPGDDEVVVRIEASPINPSDMALLLGNVDLSTLVAGDAGKSEVRGTVPQTKLADVKGRIGKPLTIGTEAAGTVVAAGRNVSAMEGKRVSMWGGAMFADYRKIAARDVMVLPEGTAAADGASLLVNPVTALGFVETAQIEGHGAIIQTAAASNLGQILVKICLADKIPLVNIVRSEEQVEILRGIGATHIINSNDEGFASKLTNAIAETGATVAFDAIGGGTMASDILAAMERVSVSKMTDYSRYGSTDAKQVYIYGQLDVGQTILNRPSFGYAYSVSGWLIMNFLRKAGPKVEQRFRARIIKELNTTFKSHYTSTISLADVLDPEVIRSFNRKATGEKYLIDPTIG